MALISPILNRELITFLRSKRAFAGLLVFLFILTLAACLCWWAALVETGTQRPDVLSRTLFITVTLSQLFIASAYALILTCTKINSERDAKTFDLLASLPMTSFHIIMAKYSSAMVVLLLLILASAPFMSMCFLLGGVGWEETLSAYYITMVTVLTYGMIGVACSTVCRKNYTAVVAGFLVGLLFYIGIPAFLAFLEDSWISVYPSARGLKAYVAAARMTASPFFAYALHCIGGARAVPFSPGTHLVYFTVFHIAVFLGAFLVAWIGFRALAGRRREPIRRGRRRRLLRPARSDETKPQAPPPKHRRRFDPFSDGANPVYEREDRSFVSPNWKHRLSRYALASVVFMILWGIFRLAGGMSSYQYSEHMCLLGMSMTFLIWLFVPPLAARMITIERETHTLPLLIATSLGPLQIVLGKMAVLMKRSFRTEVILTFLILWGFADAWTLDGAWRIIGDWLKILLPLCVITLFVASIGLFFSVLCRKTITAIVITYAVILALACSPVIVLIVGQLLGQTWNTGRFRFLSGEAFPFLCPIVSPVLYFFPEEQVNLWHENDRWSTIIGYSIWMLNLSAAILAVATIKFMRGSRNRARGA